MNQLRAPGGDVVGVLRPPLVYPSVSAGNAATDARNAWTPVRVFFSVFVALGTVGTPSVLRRHAIACENVISRRLGLKVGRVDAAAVWARVSRETISRVASVVDVEAVRNGANEVLVSPSVRTGRLAVNREDRVPLPVGMRTPAPAAIGENLVVDVEPVQCRQVTHVESVARMESGAK